MTDYTPSGKPVVGRAISREIRTEFSERIAPAINSKADIASPALTGTPTAPTATAGSSGAQIATLDFVNATSFSTNLPGQSGNNGKVIVTDGTNASWIDTFAVPWTFNDTITVNAAATLTDAINTARATVASHATTADIWGAAGNEIDFTGTATITDFPDAPQAGVSRVLHIASTPTFTHNANIFLPNNISYTAEPGDVLIVHALTTSTFRITLHQINLLQVIRSPIFSGNTLNKLAVTVGDDIAATSFSTGLPSGSINVVYGLGLFVAYTSASSGFVATSTDGEVWILRAMPSSSLWRVGYSNNKFLAVGTASNVVAQSDDGISWVPSPNLAISPGGGTYCTPVGIGDTRVIYGSTTQYNLSTNNGASWVTGTLPVSPSTPGFIIVVGSNFVFNSAAGVYYSPTGLTSSWVLSSGDSVSWLNPDGSVGNNSDGTRRSLDALTWTNVVTLADSSSSASSSNRYYIDGVTGIFTKVSGESYTFHGVTKVPRISTRESANNNRICATNGSGISIIGADSGYVIKITNDLTSLFTV